MLSTWFLFNLLSIVMQEGGFYSAEDADSLPTADSEHKREGAFCVWTHSEVNSLLTQAVEGKPDITAADVFCAHYDIREHGNVNPYQVKTTDIQSCLLDFAQDKLFSIF